jgi:hypothetical protein
MLARRIQRLVLVAPDPIARTAARLVIEPEQRWLLRQARGVRLSYADAVLRRRDERARSI